MSAGSYSVTTSAQTVVSVDNAWSFTHSSGTANVFLDLGNGAVEVLRPGGSVSLSTASVSARTTSGTATLVVADFAPSYGGDGFDGGAP